MPLPYPGADLTITQLLHALQRKLESGIHSARLSGGRALVESTVDELEADLRKGLLATRSLRNSYQPANRLPPELIVHISSYFRGLKEKVLLTATHVCTYWRQTIISCPTLWVNISNEHRRLIPLYLDRSKSSPLRLAVEGGAAEQLTPLIAPLYTRRIDTLLCELPGILMRDFLRILPSPSTLRDLTLYVSDEELRSTQEPEFDFLSEDIPSLTHLELLRFPLTPQMVRLTHIINLTISRDRLESSTLLDLLSSNPRLVDVKLDFRVTYSPDDTRGDGEVSLPQVRRFSWFNCNTSDLLQRLTIPRGADIFLSASPLSDYRPLTQKLLPRSPQYLQNLSDIQTTQVLNTSLSGLSVAAWGPSGSLRFTVPHLPRWPLLDGLPAQTVGTFRYTEVAGTDLAVLLTPNVIEEALSALEYLHTLVLANCSRKTFDLFFTALTDPNLSPTLTTVIIRICEESNTWFDGFVKVLEVRKVKRVRVIQRSETELTEEEEKMLLKYVEEVEIDSVDDHRALAWFLDWDKKYEVIKAFPPVRDADDESIYYYGT